MINEGEIMINDAELMFNEWLMKVDRSSKIMNPTVG